MKSTFAIDLDGMEAEMIALALDEKAIRCASALMKSHYRVLAGKIRKAKHQFHSEAARHLEERYG
jgi:hypothetical protein